ncbi:protein OSB2, chloroplastic-like [Bidens hawaiensis]|uniref:protein OSB2, chloroplastic-like n=1 Tax=Bidens hawaiensis TaxID=980011 RepID=UPI00404B6C97
MNSIRRAITVQQHHHRLLLLKLSSTSTVQHQHQHQHQQASFYGTTTTTLRVSKTSTSTPPPSKTTTLNAPLTSPKPSEIPWQAKVVNSVNLIGRVKIPVQFQTSSDCKCWAGTVISQDDNAASDDSSPTSFWIPVIFEGDLAHIAMCHLKEKDYVHVAGHLSVDVPPFKLSEVQANVQVMANTINFVENSQSKKISTPDELHKPTKISLKEADFISMQQDTLSKKSAMDIEPKSSPVYNSNETRHLHSDHKGGKQSSHGSWRDLLTNSKLWVDNREKKSKGLVKPNYPDFKHKDTGVALWLNKATPVDVLQGLNQLEFFSQPNKSFSQPNMSFSQPNKSFGQPNKSEKDGEFWKHLIENPNKWWDNRVDKKNVKGPDFKNKDSGKALWLTDAPSWALSSLPPVATKTDYVNTKKKQASN